MIDKSSLNQVIGFGCIWEKKDFQPVGGPSYKLDLPGEYNISVTFNVSDLSPFDVDDDSRTNHFEERGNDDNQQAFKDPLHVPVGPITKARSKKIKEALNGLIQEIWDDSNAGHSKCGPKEDECVINLIQAIEG